MTNCTKCGVELKQSIRNRLHELASSEPPTHVCDDYEKCEERSKAPKWLMILERRYGSDAKFKFHVEIVRGKTAEEAKQDAIRILGWEEYQQGEANFEYTYKNEVASLRLYPITDSTIIDFEPILNEWYTLGVEARKTRERREAKEEIERLRNLHNLYL